MSSMRFHVDSAHTLTTVLESMPRDVKIVTEVRMSMCSGWGEIKEAVYHEDLKTLELIFS